MSKAATSVYSRLKNAFTNSFTTAAATATIHASRDTPSTFTKISRNEEKKLEKFVKKFKESSKSSSFRRRHNHYAATVRRLASAQKFSMVEDILEHQKKFDDITSENFVVRLILLYSYAGMFEHALKLFDEMPQLKCKRTIWSFNALLTSCVKSKKYDKVEEIFKQVSNKLGITPNIISYNIVIKAYCETGSLHKALLILDELEKNGLHPDLITYNTLLEAFYKNGQSSKGDELWCLMETNHVAHDIRSYNSKLRGLVNDNKLSQAVNSFDEMVSKGIKPDLHTYNALISGYIKDGNLEETKKWYSELVKKGCEPDVVSYNMLIAFLCEKGKMDMALELCKEAIGRRKLSRPSMFKPMVDELVKEAKVEEAMKLLELGNLKKYFSYNIELPLGK